MKNIRHFLNRKLKLNEESDIKAIIVQFFKFGLVGVLNTLISWTCYYCFIWIDSDLYMIGGAVGGIISIANAFFLNDHFVFKNDYNRKKGMLKRLIKTYISYGGTTLLSMILLWVEVSIFHLNKKYAPPVNLIITIPINFILNKVWTFNDKENR